MDICTLTFFKVYAIVLILFVRAGKSHYQNIYMDFFEFLPFIRQFMYTVTHQWQQATKQGAYHLEQFGVQCVGQGHLDYILSHSQLIHERKHLVLITAL